MKIHIDYIDQTESTNSYFAKQSAPPSSLMKVIVARSQSAGRGQGTNSWESEDGKNLTFLLISLVRRCPFISIFTCQ